ncbi:MAG: hypothetical protein O9256_03185 [Rhizobiaceae bacterium]|nr:hypothetical protein [Rhizobiaceae bacterium]MCZ8353053.1 hypothetical protein [Rhizobium sp.]
MASTVGGDRTISLISSGWKATGCRSGQGIMLGAAIEILTNDEERPRVHPVAESIRFQGPSSRRRMAIT